MMITKKMKKEKMKTQDAPQPEPPHVLWFPPTPPKAQDPAVKSSPGTIETTCRVVSVNGLSVPDGAGGSIAGVVVNLRNATSPGFIGDICIPASGLETAGILPGQDVRLSISGV